MIVAVAATPAAAAAQSSAEPSLVVDLQDGGDAVVALTLTYDLETDDERAAFRTLQNDSEARADARERFRSRMAAVASDAGNATGREMSVTDAAVDVAVSDDGQVGVVELSVTWTDLAAVEGDRLVVTEPFASGFEPDRPFSVRGPDGHRLAGATPAPADDGANAATWEAGTDLAGFEATFAPADEGGTPTASDGDGTAGEDGGDGGDGGGVGPPGFGAGVALLALLAAAVALARRR